MTTAPFRHEVHVDATPEQVFPFLTRPELMTLWMGDHADLCPRPGGEFRVDVNGVPVRGRFVVVDPPTRLVVTWGHAGSAVMPSGTTTVEITLSGTPAGTRVTLEHRDLPAQERAQHAVGWPHFLDRLALAASGRDPDPDPFAGRD